MAQYSFQSLRAGYRDLWSRMKVVKTAEATSQAKRVIANKARYRAIEARTGVPWFVVGCLHMRESNGNFGTYLGNGQPLNRRTTIVPKGRGPFSSFEDGAYDALVTVEHLDEITEWGPEHVAYAMEKFNGFGYRHPSRNIPSPYLWGGTSVQQRGKFVRDGVYDPAVMDSQLGGMAVLKQIMELDATARFRPARPVPAPELQPEPEDDDGEDPPISPPARDTEGQVKPLPRSKTIWGGVLQWFASAGAAIVAALAGVPWQVWVVLLLFAALGVYLVIKGRIDVDRIVRHLSDDDTAEARP
jgi:lysozyme family protein